MPATGVKWFAGVKPDEIYQSFNIKFAFANETADGIEQCHQWVKCRDFLHDAIRTMLTGNASSIYSFSFSKDKNPDIYMDGIRLLVSKKDVTSAVKFRPVLTRALKLINHFEALAGVELSTIRKVEEDKKAGYKHVWLFSGPKFWLSAPHLVSLYTYLIRLGDKDIKFSDAKTLRKALEELSKVENPKGDNDLKYLTKVWNKIETVTLFNNAISKLNGEGFSELYFEDANISSFHNKTGIVSACTAATWNTEFNKRINKALKEAK